MTTFYTPSGIIEIDNDNPDPEKLELVNLTRQEFEDMFNLEKNWTNFRHNLKISDIFALVAASTAIPALTGSYLMDSLRQNDYIDLIQSCAMVDNILHFTQEQKDEVNTMASNNYLPGPIFS